MLEDAFDSFHVLCPDFDYLIQLKKKKNSIFEMYGHSR